MLDHMHGHQRGSGQYSLLLLCVLTLSCAGNQGRGHPEKKPVLKPKPVASTRAWKPGASPCLGFKPDGSAAYVLVTETSGGNLSNSTEYKVVRVDFATKKISVALAVAEEVDCNLEEERCKELGIEATGNGEDDQLARADAKLAAAASRITALIRREGLAACVSARNQEDNRAAGDRWLLGTGEKAAVLHVVPDGKPGEEENQPARKVNVVAGQTTHHLMDLQADEMPRQQRIHAVFYLPRTRSVLLVVRNDDQGVEEEKAHAFRY